MAWKMSIVSSILKKKRNNNPKSTFTKEPFPRGKALWFVETPNKSVSADTFRKFKHEPGA